jgi:hypothetical protein
VRDTEFKHYIFQCWGCDGACILKTNIRGYSNWTAEKLLGRLPKRCLYWAWWWPFRLVKIKLLRSDLKMLVPLWKIAGYMSEIQCAVCENQTKVCRECDEHLDNFVLCKEIEAEMEKEMAELDREMNENRSIEEGV